MNNEFEKTGRVWIRQALTHKQCSELTAISQVNSHFGQRISNNSKTADFIQSTILAEKLAELDLSSTPVRIVSFNKTPNNNWNVPWHQDRVIAVKEKHAVAGFTNWSTKSKIHHCEAPISILQRMAFARIHLDDADETNGAMQIAIGSHNAGAVKSSSASKIATDYPVETTRAKKGDVLILKMLILHRSSPSSSDKERKTLRVDYASTHTNLPSPLSWA